MSATRADRAIAAALALVSLGLVFAVFAVWSQAGQIKTNQQLIRQQQATVDLLLARSAEDRRDAEQLRSLVQTLQRQVRDLGGTPAELPPSRRTDPEPSVTGPASPSRPASPAASGSPAPSRPTPRPSHHPSSPTPTPSPSPTRTCVGPVCLPPGAVR